MAVDTPPLQADEGVCNDTRCFRDEPSLLVKRRLKGTERVAQYCVDHDPMDDAHYGDQWETVNEWF